MESLWRSDGRAGRACLARLRYAPPALEPPLRLSAYAWEAQPGRLSMTVSCELTVKLVHGAEAQFVEASPFYDEVLLRTAEADFRVPFKPRSDVLLLGHAYAPVDDAEADRLLVRMRIGEYSKAIRVTGDRFWLREGGRLVAGPPRKWRRILLSPDRATRTPENPQGIDLEAVPVEHRIALPNLEPASVGYSPIFGPVAPNTPSRGSLIHPMALGWVHALLTGQRAGPPPDGFNFAYFNLAPLDQQLPEIPVGAAIVLENVHPEHPIYTSRLPAMRPRAFVFDPQALQQLEIPLRCDTLWLDADREIATLVFRGVIPISHPDLATQVMARVEPVERGASIPSPQMKETHMGVESVGGGLPFTKAPPRKAPLASDAPQAPKPAATRPLPGGMFVTQEIAVGPGLGVLPFDGRFPPNDDFETTQSLIDDPTTATSARPPPPRAPPPPSEPPDDPTPRPYEARIERRQSGRLVPPDIGPTPAPPLPNRSEAGAPLSRTSPGTPVDALSQVSKNAPRASSVKINIDESPTPAPVASMPSLALRPPPSTRLGALQLGTGKLASSDIPPPLTPMAPAQAPSAPPPVRADSTNDPATTETTSAPENQYDAGEATRAESTGDGAETASAQKNAPEESTVAGETKPIAPPRISALSKNASFAEEVTDSSTSDSRGIEARTLEEADADADRDAFEFPLPPSDGFEVDGVTLEHCAAIRAAMAMPGAERGAVLTKHDLDEVAFARIEKTHLGRIDQETSSGVQDLLNRYDAAYVAAQDTLRSPIGVKEYARIAVARKEGDLADVMAELGVPRSELMRLDRVWKRRITEHPGVDATLKSLIESLGNKR